MTISWQIWPHIRLDDWRQITHSIAVSEHISIRTLRGCFSWRFMFNCCHWETAINQLQGKHSSKMANQSIVRSIKCAIFFIVINQSINQSIFQMRDIKSIEARWTGLWFFLYCRCESIKRTTISWSIPSVCSTARSRPPHWSKWTWVDRWWTLEAPHWALILPVICSIRPFTAPGRTLNASYISTLDHAPR